MSEGDIVEYRVQDRVAEIVMRREPVNAINMALTRAINQAYRRSKDDPEVRAAISPAAAAVPSASEWTWR